MDVDVGPLVLRLRTATSNRGSCAPSAATATTEATASSVMRIIPFLDDKGVAPVQGQCAEVFDPIRPAEDPMLRYATLLTASLALLATACGSEPKNEAPAPAISTSAADNLVPGQLARGAALQTEIRSAGHDCNKVVRTFNQGGHDGGDVWDAE